ncbi:hypothetical protein CAOG_03606 [Capsaspora owczarzaki ATCC 30864]|uniref:SGNH hydrolase-type esterase domain-containing protein n=1 Tax=Capsaspora owczarzaki (strain ATCC 30864) TaxID=595528 RepID=A0A0D2WNI9_CAPO3|nr:hypothetical protein CAOG_03606 [Capsaspora owczarzaki ATCC 30864]KJE92690.1 hypothetical protein CAOG_003606 [Capsaspora owczarzaki ATCC 30864]|eukprot:XP_004363334.2 hypothetical protein CAOG_03606 [Capsaspora owczarzaki ATCC 30864]
MRASRLALTGAFAIVALLGLFWLRQPQPPSSSSQHGDDGHSAAADSTRDGDLAAELASWRVHWPTTVHSDPLSVRAAVGRPAAWTYLDSQCSSPAICESLLENAPCPDGPTPALTPSDPRFGNHPELNLPRCSYRRIASCFPRDLQTCFARRLLSNHWLVIVGDSVTRNTLMEFFMRHLPQSEQVKLQLSSERNLHVPSSQYQNEDYLLFGRFLVTFRFIGGAGGNQTRDNLVQGVSLSAAARTALLSRLSALLQARNETIPDAELDVLYRKPDIVVINSGLWDSRSSSPSYRPNYYGSMHMWRRVLQEQLGLDAKQLYWRSSTPVSPELHVTDQQRKNMTNERIAELNWIAHDVLVRQAHWHSIDAFTAVGGFVPPVDAISYDGYHPTTLASCALNDMVFGAICDKEASPL